MYIIVFSLNFLTVNELSTERHFIVWTAKLNQHVYYKGIMTSEFGSKNMLLWKRRSSFVSKENENLWISSRLMWFDGPRHTPQKVAVNMPKGYFIQQKAGSTLERTMSKFPRIGYKCLFTFKEEYAINLNTLH